MQQEELKNRMRILHLRGENADEVGDFCYLNSQIATYRTSLKDIKQGMAQIKQAFNEKKKLQCPEHVSLETESSRIFLKAAEKKLERFERTEIEVLVGGAAVRLHQYWLHEIQRSKENREKQMESDIQSEISPRTEHLMVMMTIMKFTQGIPSRPSINGTWKRGTAI